MHSFWENCCTQLKEELTQQQFNTWIKPLEPVEFDGKTFCISAPNRPKLDCVKSQFLERINTLAERFWGRSIEIELILSKKPSPQVASKETKNLKVAEKTEKIKNFYNALPTEEISAAYAESGLNRTLSFENFVTGKANQLAHAAAIQVSDNPGTSYNPLFIYGGVGLGKTHLIHAIGNKIIAANPSALIRYIRADNYVNSAITAYQRKGFDDFKRYYQSLDMLLIDDIQFIGGNKTRTQEEFFYVFESLIARNKQIIITSDQQPKELSGIDKRLTTRFASGIAVHVEPPELEMRVAILQKKALQQNERISDEVAFFVAKNIRSNVRELEGALNNLLAYSKLFDIHNEKISVDVAKTALKDLLSVQNRQISIENIQKTVAEYYGIKISDMYSKQRTRKIAHPRQIAMYLAKELTQKSLPEIGELFGGRDHTTVLHAVRKLQKDRHSDTKLNHDLHVLEQTLKA